MLKIIIELHPYGNAEKKEVIATMDLWNDLGGTPTEGSYQARSTILPSPWNKNPEYRGGAVVGHLRSLPVWNLVAKMLHQLGYGVSNTYRKNEVSTQRKESGHPMLCGCGECM